MATLTEDQKAFLRSHKISNGELFDASGMRAADYKSHMKGTNWHFAFGVTPCESGGHTIRTKNGHCVQCNLFTIAIIRRHHSAAEVYIAGSYSQKLIKIGSSTDPYERMSKLNDVSYGGAFDGEVLARVSVNDAGKVETETQKRLSAFTQPGTYVRAGAEITCYELFRCSYTKAKRALIAGLPKEVELKIQNESRNLTRFEFQFKGSSVTNRRPTQRH